MNKCAALVLGLVALSAIVVAQDCQLVVPPRPLTAAGLATPYKLQFNATSTANCIASNIGNLAFVHGVIADTATGAIHVYNPLVITANDTAAIQPTPPTLPATAVVGLWFGYNGGNLRIISAVGTNSLADGNCVPGLNVNGVIDPFVQYAYCNAPAFFNAVNGLIAAGKVVIPPLGAAADGVTCPNVRSFDAVDQDPGDNVPTQYLIDAQTNMLAQFSTANMGQLNNPTVATNPSDNALIGGFIMPAVGCATSVWKVPDLADNGNLVIALPMNEIQANKFAIKPQALVPLNHAFTVLTTTGAQSAPKTNLYRAGVNQPPISEVATNVGSGQANPTLYCANYNKVGGPRLAGFKALLGAVAGPGGNGQTLYQFLTARFTAANQILGCANLIGAGNLFTNF